MPEMTLNTSPSASFWNVSAYFLWPTPVWHFTSSHGRNILGQQGWNSWGMLWRKCAEMWVFEASRVIIHSVQQHVQNCITIMLMSRSSMKSVATEHFLSGPTKEPVINSREWQVTACSTSEEHRASHDTHHWYKHRTLNCLTPHSIGLILLLFIVCSALCICSLSYLLLLCCIIKCWNPSVGSCNLIHGKDMALGVV